MQTPRLTRIFQGAFEQVFRTYHVPVRIPRNRAPIRAFSTPALRTPITPTTSPPTTTARRHHSDETSPSPSTPPLTDRETSSPESAASIAVRKALAPAYQLWFTCKRCLERSGHTVSKQAYHFGTCVINCPKCKSQHLIADHLKIFEDHGVTLEEIAKRHGEKLRRGRLGDDGDVEFYEDSADDMVALEGQQRVRGSQQGAASVRREVEELKWVGGEEGMGEDGRK